MKIPGESFLAAYTTAAWCTRRPHTLHTERSVTQFRGLWTAHFYLASFRLINYFDQNTSHFSESMPFVPHGTREGGAWRKRLVFVSATAARGRTVEAAVTSRRFLQFCR